MDKIKINFTDMEKMRIKHWAEYSIYDSGHWGDGAATLPEEDIVLKKLDTKSEVIELYPSELDIILYWAESFISRTGMIGEDEVLYKKIVAKNVK